jgi:hypothetical protein
VRLLHHFLTTQMESWGFIKLSSQTYIVHMKVSLPLGFSAQIKPRGLHGGHHYKITNLIMEDLSPHNHTSELHSGPYSII